MATDHQPGTTAVFAPFVFDLGPWTLDLGHSHQHFAIPLVTRRDQFAIDLANNRMQSASRPAHVKHNSCNAGNLGLTFFATTNLQKMSPRARNRPLPIAFSGILGKPPEVFGPPGTCDKSPSPRAMGSVIRRLLQSPGKGRQTELLNVCRPYGTFGPRLFGRRSAQ